MYVLWTGGGHYQWFRWWALPVVQVVGITSGSGGGHYQWLTTSLLTYMQILSQRQASIVHSPLTNVPHENNNKR